MFKQPTKTPQAMDVLKTVLEAILSVVAGSDLPDPSQRQFVAKKELSERDATVSLQCGDVTPNIQPGEARRCMISGMIITKKQRDLSCAFAFSLYWNPCGIIVIVRSLTC